MSQYTNDLHSLSHTKWNCKYHVVFAPGFRQLEKVRYSNVRINSAFFMSNEKFLCSDSSGM